MGRENNRKGERMSLKTMIQKDKSGGYMQIKKEV